MFLRDCIGETEETEYKCNTLEAGDCFNQYHQEFLLVAGNS